MYLLIDASEEIAQSEQHLAALFQRMQLTARRSNCLLARLAVSAATGLDVSQ